MQERALHPDVPWLMKKPFVGRSLPEIDPSGPGYKPTETGHKTPNKSMLLLAK